MSELVFFLEEASAKAMLEQLIPRIVPAGLVVRLFPFEGKQDLEAVSLAYEKPALAIEAGRARYRDPDSIESPSRELRRIVPEYQKIEGSRRIGAFIDPENRRSRSFHHLVSSICRLVEDLPA